MKERIKIGCAIVKDNKLLFVRERGKKGYILPGGRLKKGENEIDCIRRELKEELNVSLISAKYLFTKKFRKSVYDGLPVTVKIYLTKIKGDLNPSREIVEYKWIGREEMNKFITMKKMNNYRDLFKIFSKYCLKTALRSSKKF